MKKQLLRLISVLAVSSILLAVPVSAAENGTSRMAVITSSDDTSKIESDTPKSTDRLALFKTKFKINLTETEKTNLKLKCVGAQGVVGKLNEKFGNSVAT